MSPRASRPPLSTARGWLSILLLCAMTTAIGATQPAGAQSNASPLDHCGRAGWAKVPGLAAEVAVHSLAVDATRLYASGFVDETASGIPHTWSMALDDLALWQVEGTMIGRRVSALMLTPGDPEHLAWAAGFGNDGIYAAPPEDPMRFEALGSLTAWPMQLMRGSSGTFAAFAKAGQVGIHRWDGVAWQRTAGGEAFDVAGVDAPLAFWAAASGPDRIFLGAERRGLWSASAAEGSGWQWIGDPELRASTVSAIALDEQHPGRMAVGLGPAVDGSIDYRGLRTSDDGGVEWSPAAFDPPPVDGEQTHPNPELISDVHYSRLSGNTLIASVYGQGLNISRDAGTAWQRMLVPVDTPNGIPDDKSADFAGVPVNYIVALDSVLLEQPAGCELLFAGGIGGLWVMDLGSLDRLDQVYLPKLDRNHDSGKPPTATVPATGSVLDERSDPAGSGRIPNRDSGALQPSPPASPTPTAPRALPSSG